jgi:hypothetical protein
MLKKKLIMTQDKSLLGDSHDILIDDRPEKANCAEFPGRLIHFGNTHSFVTEKDDFTEPEGPRHPRYYRALTWLDVQCVFAGWSVPVPECQDGWQGLISPLVRLCNERGVTILQIKEKFGTLRFYVGSADDEVYAAIDRAEKQSAQVCEACGKPAVTRSNGNWFKTLCDEHARRWLSGR